MISLYRLGSWRLDRCSASTTAFLFLSLLTTGPLHAQVGSVTGTVLDASTGQPLDAVQVSLERVGAESSGIGGLSRATGRFLLMNVPVGQYLLRAQLMGFGQATQILAVTAGETVVMDLRLTPEAIPLSEIVVTGVIGATQRTKLPFDVAQVRMADLPVPSVSASTTLQGKVAGVQVMELSGRPGNTASVLLRGVTSLNASGRSQDPVYIVDEVILASDMVDLDALDIQSIDVVKGAAAASLYGSRAANGVIHIRTKRGAEFPDDEVRYTLRSEMGRSDVVRIPSHMANRYHPYALDETGTAFLDKDGSPCAWIECKAEPLLAGQLAEGGTVTVWNTYDANPWPGRTYNQAERFFTHGPFMQTHLTAEGRSGQTNFHVSASRMNEDGIILFLPGYQRTTFRANLDQAVRQHFTLQTSVFFSRASEQLSERRSSLADIVGVAPIVDLLAPDPNVPDEIVLKVSPTLGSNPLYDLKYTSAMGEKSRFLGAVTARYTPREWLALDGNVSFDRATEDEERFYPKGYRSLAPTGMEDGYLYEGSTVTEALNGNLTASTHWNLLDGVRGTSQLRYLVEFQDIQNLWTDGFGFAVERVPTLSALDQESAWAGSSQKTIRSDGFFFITNLDLYDRYVVDALVRNDGSSLFGEDQRRQWYYRLGGAWRLSQEDFFDIPGVDELKLRYSVGTAGGRPRFEAQYETFSVDMGRVSPFRLGNKDLKPEFSTEHEAGFDLSLFEYRAMLTVTHARTETKNQILNVPLPQLSGYVSQWQNAGTIESSTWEATLDLRLFPESQVDWSAKILFDATDSRISQLNIPAFKYGSGWSLATFYAREGEDIGTFYGLGPARSCADLPQETSCDEFAMNDDGFLVWVGSGGSLSDRSWGTEGPSIAGSKVMWGTPFVGFCRDRVSGEQTQYCPLGNTLADYNLGFSSQVKWRGWGLYALLSRSVGADVLYNLNWVAESDEGDAPAEARKPIGYYQSWYTIGASNVNGIYVADATFTKLRELSLTYRIDPSLVQKIPLLGGVKGLGLNLTGRNLYVWTDYPGFDPEVGYGGGETGSAVIGRIDNYNYPSFRTWTFGLEVNF